MSLLIKAFSHDKVFLKDVSRSVDEPKPVGRFHVPSVNVSLSFESVVYLMFKQSVSVSTNYH